jgi:hypothetical protein
MQKMLLAQLAALLLILAGSSTTAWAQDDEEETDIEVSEEDTEEDDEDDWYANKKWNISGGISNRVGQGTFVTPANDSQYSEDEIGSGSNAYDRVQMSYSLSPSYSFDPLKDYKVDDFSLSASLAVTQWLTQGGGVNYPREVRFQDIGLSLGWGGYSFDKAGIRLGGGLGFSLPTSKFSQIATTRLGTSASLSLSKQFVERINLSLGVSGGKTFHKYKSPAVDITRTGDGNVLFRAGGGEDLQDNLVAIGGINTEYFVGTSISASLRIVDSLSFSASYSLGNFWTYQFDNDDELRSPYADAGRGFGQSVSTGVGLRYSFLDYFSISGGARSAMPPKTADNRSFRFPFWNMEGAAANRSSLYISLGASY